MKKIILALTLLTSSSLMAQTAYVSDELDIMVRSGKSASHRIIATLKSGNKVNVTERDTVSGYSKIKLSATRDGWVLSRLLVKSPSARARLAAAEKKAAKLQVNIALVNKQLAELQLKKGSLDSQSAELSGRNNKLVRELDQLKKTSSNAVKILAERNQLQQRVVTIERELEGFKRENATLKSSSAQDWFLIGAAVLLLGVVLGFILPKLSWRRKSSWQSSF